MTGAAALLMAMTTPAPANFFDFLFGGGPSAPAASRGQSGGLPDPFAPEQQPAPPPTRAASTNVRSNFTHCVRMCDGKHFPLLNRGGNSPVAMCQAFCPASEAKVFFGSDIDRAISMDGERYSELKNAYAYRQALSPSCTCNGRDPAGLAPVDLSMDATLRPGDIVATGDGFVAYNGKRNGGADFTPLAEYSGLTDAARARLSAMKIAPVRADLEQEYTMSVDTMEPVETEHSRPTLN